MERLTVKCTDKVYDTLDPVDILDNEYSKTNYNKLLTKLGEYEDLEEQGLLLRLPIKPGDIVYIISTARRFHDEIIPLKVHGIDIRKDDFTILAKNEKYCGYSISTLFGKHESVDWFLTQEDAEQKLKEMESD